MIGLLDDADDDAVVSLAESPGRTSMQLLEPASKGRKGRMRIAT